VGGRTNDGLDRRTFVKTASAGAAGGGLLSACTGESSPAASGAGAAGPEVTWRMATSFPPALDLLHGGAELIAERVSALTGGRFTIRVFAAGELVPGLQVMDSVMAGTVQAGYTGDYYYIGKSPALAFGSSVPFGLTARQQIAWLTEGGGRELMNEVYSDFGIRMFPCGNTGAQFGGWFRDPVESLADMRGLRMRIPGLAGEIMTRLGVAVQVLGGAEIYAALERGAIDATEFVGPYDDEKLGFHEIAKNYYIPGWWEPGQSAFDELPPHYQEILESVCREVNLVTLARYDTRNPPALERLTSEHGVTVRTFSDEILQAAWDEAHAYYEEQASADAAFRRVYDSWREFRAQSFPYFAGNETAYARFAFDRVG